VKKKGSDFCSVEQQIIGLDHQQLGQGLAEQWKFPRPCQLVAGYHHQPENLADQSRLLVNLVFVADTLVAHSKHGFPLTACNQQLEPTRLADLQIEQSAVDATKAKLTELVSEACVLLA